MRIVGKSVFFFVLGLRARATNRRISIGVTMDTPNPAQATISIDRRISIRTTEDCMIGIDR